MVVEFPGLDCTFRSATQCIGSFCRASQSIMSLPYKVDPIGWHIETFAIICDFKMRLLSIKRETDMDLGRFGMPDHIGKRLLENTEQCQPNFLRQDLTIVCQ